MNDRPKIKIPLDKTDKTILAVVIILGCFLWIFSSYLFYISPEKVPAHYDFSGKVTRLDNKIILLLLPALGTIVCIGLYILSKYPNIYNYPLTITTENAAANYKKGSKLMRFLMLGILVLFSFFQLEFYKSIKNNFSAIPKWDLPLILLITMATPIVSALFFYTPTNKKST